jgi:hypothetical protein
MHPVVEGRTGELQLEQKRHARFDGRTDRGQDTALGASTGAQARTDSSTTASTRWFDSDAPSSDPTGVSSETNGVYAIAPAHRGDGVRECCGR